MTNSRPHLDIDTRMLKGGVVLLFIGCGVWLAGAALSATSLGKAATKWVSELEESPSEMAQRRYHQFKAAAAAGTKAWRDEPADQPVD